MILLIFLIYILIRIYPYLLSPVPLGYNGGLYIYLWHHDLSIPWLRTIYPPLIFYVGQFLNLFTNPENYLIPVSFVISSLLFLSVYLYTKNKWTLFILTISAIQYKFWWWYYIKNILAASCIFFYLYFDKQKSKFKYLFPILLPLLHQPTAIIFFIILLINKNIKSIILFIISFTIYYLPNYALTIAPFLKTTATTIGVESGTFYGLKESLLLMIPYLLFAIIELNNQKNKNKISKILFSILFLIPALGLFLSRRFIPLFDLFAIILAGEFLYRIKTKFKYLLIPLFLIFAILYIHKNSPALINIDEYQEIKLLKDTPPTSSILVTDNEYTPWVYGYSGRRAITPGFGENDIYWTDQEWQDFWLSGDKAKEISLLKKLPQPLYIWKGDKNLPTKFSLTGDCFQRYSWHVFQFVCR